MTTVYLIEVMGINPEHGYKATDLAFLFEEEAVMHVKKRNRLDIYSYGPKYRYTPVHVVEEFSKELKKNF